MASANFDKYLKLLFDNKPPGDVVKVDSMRSNMDRVGGKYPEGVTGEAATVNGVPGEWVWAEGADSDAVVLYLHGGGYVAGSIASHKNLTGHLAKAVGCRVFVADYRLAPENPFPAAVDDAVAAYRGLVNDEGIDPARIAVSGDSAGGGLTVATLLALRDEGDPLPSAAVPISAWIDLDGTGDSMKTRAEADPMVTPGSLSIIGGMYVGDGDRKDPLASPIHADMTGLPPMLIQVGDAEVLLDDSVRLAAMIEAAGGEATLKVWPEMVHVWHAAAGFVPESDEAIKELADFVRPLVGI